MKTRNESMKVKNGTCNSPKIPQRHSAVYTTFPHLELKIKERSRKTLLLQPTPLISPPRKLPAQTSFPHLHSATTTAEPHRHFFSLLQIYRASVLSHVPCHSRSRPMRITVSSHKTKLYVADIQVAPKEITGPSTLPRKKRRLITRRALPAGR